MNALGTLPDVTAPTPPLRPTARTELVRRLIAKGAVILSTLVACVIVLEAGLRVIGRYQMDNTKGYFEQGGISFVLKKNVNKHVAWPTMSFTVCTSDLGFRTKKPGPSEIGLRPYYVVLGASDAFGNGLDYEKTFVGVLAGKLDRHGIDVVNMAVAGHHLQEQIALFKSFAQSTTNHPQAVITIFNPLFIGGYDDNHPNVIVRRGDLFDKDNWKIALARKFLQNTSAAYCFFRDAIRHLQQKYSGGEDAELSFYIKRFSAKHRIHQPEVTQGFLKELKKLEDLIRSTGAKPVFVYCPPAGVYLLNDLMEKGKLEKGLVDTAYFADIVRNHAESEGIRFIDLNPPVQARNDRGEKLNFDRDGHYNGPTSALVGEYLYAQLKAAETNSFPTVSNGSR